MLSYAELKQRSGGRMFVSRTTYGFARADDNLLHVVFRERAIPRMFLCGAPGESTDCFEGAFATHPCPTCFKLAFPQSAHDRAVAASRGVRPGTVRGVLEIKSKP